MRDALCVSIHQMSRYNAPYYEKSNGLLGLQRQHPRDRVIDDTGRIRSTNCQSGQRLSTPQNDGARNKKDKKNTYSEWSEWFPPSRTPASSPEPAGFSPLCPAVEFSFSLSHPLGPLGVLSSHLVATNLPEQG
ncbi:hypothetical protein HN011_002887 [Eciton burchellii]|nr:hypothetical protein HN011_002887 [Eciton burchellii]